MNVQVSTNFRKHARKTILSIVVFAVTYVILLLLAIGITVGFTLLGLLIFTAKPMFLTAVLCLGLLATGLTILFFLLKFVFASTKVDTGHLTQIYESDEPQLFALIHEVVKEVDTSFPKKIFLSHDVNASVFYDSSFWSMFLPIKKNLQIGVGMVNAVTQQELKAILAHEFGHFSQKSMKVGSYVYHVNQIIYNMLYKNESLDNMFGKWGNISGYSAIFIGISMFIIQQIQHILKHLYEYVNLNYLALSREMEFHADEIAAHVAGSQALADSLLRLGFANHALNNVLTFYDNKFSENIRSRNIYPEHRCVMLLFAERNRYQVRNGFPQIELATLKKYDKSKLNLEDQWSSHPSDEDRVKALQKLNIVKQEANNAPAIELLANRAAVANQISDKLFAQVQYQQPPSLLEITSFSDDFESRMNKYAVDQRFNDFYDYNHPVRKGETPIFQGQSKPTFDELFADSRVDTLYELNSLKNDKYVVEAISKGELKLKSFDYDGIKYRAADAIELLKKIEDTIAATEHKITDYNQQIHSYFAHLADTQGMCEEFERRYDDFAFFDKNYEEAQELYAHMTENTRFIFQTLPFADIEARLQEVKRREGELKKKLATLLALPGSKDELDDTLLTSLDMYINRDLIYFNVDHYNEDNLQILFNAISAYKKLLDDQHFVKKKHYLNFMLTLEEGKGQKKELS
ncbi:M48 family metallopeptidase [Sphingobacterium siyangense]|jgi:Zn-dependent protease with chaperone function|uniref:M48 family metallopeptidase n=1 Tax=Sphingobacterium siyangense TaxID=459529 RepID=UPI0028A6DF73|nr:M48 family metalloprotease [Sphingobacterium siyangense]